MKPIMTLDVQTIEAAAMELNPELRARLAENLLASLESLSEAEIEALWLLEAQRRDAELGAGGAHGVPAEDALATARSRRA